jgi:hypothetical protein
MRVLNIGRSFCVLIQPDFAKDGIPDPADQEVDNDENPNRPVIDSHIH